MSRPPPVDGDHLDLLPGVGRDGAGEPEPPPPRRRKRRRRRRIILLSAFSLIVVLLFGAAGLVYVATTIPLPAQIVNPQTSIITYRDGETEIARVYAENRITVDLADVPKHVRYAVLAAENRSFYTDPGFDVRGIARAMWNNLQGEELQGGSTITQQYVKNAYLSEERTFTRKFKELVIAIKLDREYSKDQILEWYLNTIYFGRGTYGIETAAQTYFGRSVDTLSVAEGAVLAASIRAPALYDPQTHPTAAAARWDWVLDGMAEEGWLDESERVGLAYPDVLPKDAGRDNSLAGPEGHVVWQVKEELAALGINEAELNRAGLRVRTTLDSRAQDAAVAAVKEVFAGQPANLRQALVAVDPATGGVLAYYGGENGIGFDYAQAWRQPGSSFKPYVLAAALEKSHAGEEVGGRTVSVHSRFDGSSPRQFGGVEVRNGGDAQCPNCTLLEAMKRSINTVFYDLAVQVGPAEVADLAHRMGVPEQRTDNGAPTLQAEGVTDGSIGVGRYEVRPIDQAGAYATLAAGGVHRPTHFVSQITTADGEVIYDVTEDAPTSSERVLPAEVANDVTYALEPVAEWSGVPLAGGRESAAKTGTVQLGDTGDNKDAWMVGYTPAVSAAVWVGTDDNQPIRDAGGAPVFGSGLPGRTWQAFLNSYLAGTPHQDLPDEVRVGNP